MLYDWLHWHFKLVIMEKGQKIVFLKERSTDFTYKGQSWGVLSPCCLMSSVDLEELCHVWKDNPDDAIVMPSVLPGLRASNRKPALQIRAVWVLVRGVSWKGDIGCIMGNVGSSLFGAWHILGTKSEDISASVLQIFTILKSGHRESPNLTEVKY